MRAFLFCGVRFFLSLLLGLFMAQPAMAQFTVVEDAVLLGADCVQLTPNNTGQRGAAWSDCTIDVAFPFSLDLTVNLGSNDGGADGIAWMLQQNGPNTITSGNGGNMGYGNFTPALGFTDPQFNPSLIVEFDTWANGNVGDPIYDHVALQRDGTHNHNSPDCLDGCPPNTIQASSTNANIEDGIDHDVHMEWDPVTQVFLMTFDGVERINANVDLVNDVFAGDSEVYWGFTGSTGGASNSQSFCLVEFSNPSGIPGLLLAPQPPYALCPGETGTIVASATGQTVTWASLNSSTINAGVGTYVIETTNTNCPQSESITVEALPNPGLTLTSAEVTICDNTPTVLSATANSGATLDWNNTGQPSLTVSTAGTYDVTGTLETCSETLSVEVFNQNSPELSVDPGPAVSFCEGETVTVVANTDIPATIQWYVNGNGQPGNTLDITQVVDAEVIAEVSGCPGSPILLNIDVLPLPTAQLSAIPEELCWDQTGLVTAVPNPGSVLSSWTLPDGTAAPNQAGPGAYTANLTGANGCTSSSTLFLNQQPPIAFSLSAPTGACSDAMVELEVSGNHETAVWSTGTEGNTLLLSADDGTGPFEVTVGIGNCLQTEQTQIQWWPVPEIGPLPDTVIRCVLDPAVEWTWPVQPQSPVGWWVWSVNDNVTTGGPQWIDEGDYVVRVFDSMTGCADSTSVAVDVWPTLEVTAFPLSGVVCWDETTEVMAELRGAQGTNPEEIPYTLFWSESEVTGLEPTVGAGLYLLQAENACGTDVAVVEVSQEYCGCDMWVPTAFTPDNDGINDGFKVESNCPDLDEFTFQVFDRWGELVWATDDPDVTWMGEGLENPWMDGLHYVPDGVYGYRLTWKYQDINVPKIEERSGHLHILR